MWRWACAIGAEICRRLRFSNEETAQILALIDNHMRFAEVTRMKTSTLKRFFRLDRFPEHLALHRMDCRASSVDLTGHLENYYFAKERYEATPETQVRPEPLLTGAGADCRRIPAGAGVQGDAAGGRGGAVGGGDSDGGRGDGAGAGAVSAAGRLRMKLSNSARKFDVIVIGAGAAG
jgi:hypothetical protein